MVDKFMTEAIAEARAGMAEGNTPIGSVFVKDDKILGRGRNTLMRTSDPTAHAEMEAYRDAAQAIAKAVAIIQGNPDIAGAFSTTGNGPTTWARAAEETSASELIIISMDYTRPNLDLVKSGQVYGLVAQPLYEEFYAAAELVGAALDGETVEYLNLLPAPVITIDDLDEYYSFNDKAEAGINE